MQSAAQFPVHRHQIWQETSEDISSIHKELHAIRALSNHALLQWELETGWDIQIIWHDTGHLCASKWVELLVSGA